jgi:Arc/MetJ-type ribon-helix-helix transcriptional regulator
MARADSEDLRQVQDTLGKVGAQIDNLVGFLAAGDRSDSVRTRLRDLESEQRSLQARERELKANRAATSAELPDPESLLADTFELEERFTHDPAAGRAQLRRNRPATHLLPPISASRSPPPRGGLGWHVIAQQNGRSESHGGRRVD